MDRQPRRRADRRGSAALESLIIIPIFLVVVLAVVEFALLLSTEQKLAEASGVGARTGSLGRSDDDVRDAVKAVLGSNHADKSKVDIRRWNDRIGPMIEVRVQLPARAAAPSLLRSIGVDLSGDMLTGRTVMRVE